ncbi:hypothetical protein TNCV_166581 [Trichonephila clavipes]|nr:hypothetical protein TNCV_166581 [Trichonephila clavipes]
MSSPGFEPSPYGTTVSAANHYIGIRFIGNPKPVSGKSLLDETTKLEHIMLKVYGRAIRQAWNKMDLYGPLD